MLAAPQVNPRVRLGAVCDGRLLGASYGLPAAREGRFHSIHYNDRVSEFRHTSRVAPWWMCAIMLAITVFFGWVISTSLGKAPSPGVFSHILIPAYAVWLYWVLAGLLNTESLHVTRDGVVIGRGPVPLQPGETMERDQIAFCSYFSLNTGPDNGDEPVVVGHVVGLETKSGRQLNLLDSLPDAQAARATAERIASVLNEAHPERPIPARLQTQPRDDPADTRRTWLWVGVWAAAFAAGVAWEIAYRWRL